ncbi:gliding motility protein GldM [Chitinophagaceae bacterium MMS25-I14]
MSLPKEPRQLMINLMYLVLTAMLALNVSSEILHAFKTINNSVKKSNEAINGKNNETLLAFQANEQMEGHYDRVHPYYVKAQEISTEANKVYQYLEDWKERVITEAGGYDTEPDEESGGKKIKRDDDINASTRLLVELKGGDSVKQRLTDLRKFMLDRVTGSKDTLEKQLPLQIVPPGKSDNNPQGDWATGNFYNTPTVAAVTLFAKMQNDIRNSESMIIQKLFDEANATQIKFDAITAIAVPKTSYAMQGQKIEAEIMLAAYNKSVNPSISASTGQVKIEGGVGHWTSTANGVGPQHVKGMLSLNLGDRTVSQPWEFEYTVGSTGASIALDKMNVMYIGVDNPITISAAGYSIEDVSPSFPGAESVKPDPSRGKGAYLVRVNKPGELLGSITAKKQGGGSESIGATKYRVKYIPDPEAQVGQKSGGAMPASIFRAQLGVIAALKDFVFDAKFVVNSFSVTVVKKRDPEPKGPYVVPGASFSKNPQLEALVNQLKPGDLVYIDDIKATGPDGRSRTLSPLVFKLL